MQYRDETEVSWLMRTGARERLVVRTAAELEAAIVESAAPRGIYLYAGENLIQETKRRREEMTRKRTWESTRLTRATSPLDGVRLG